MSLLKPLMPCQTHLALKLMLTGAQANTRISGGKTLLRIWAYRISVVLSPEGTVNRINLISFAG